MRKILKIQTDKQPVEQAVGMLLYHSSAGSDAFDLNLLNEYVFTAAFRANRHLSICIVFCGVTILPYYYNSKGDE